MREEAVVFGPTRSLVGVVTDPAQASSMPPQTGVILLNSGLVHRVGPNRLYVKVARSLSRLGAVSLRFDLSGVGDSRVRQDNLPFPESSIEDTQEAMNLLSQTRGVERFVLLGICSGAINSFDVACRDSRVVGAVMINPLAYSDAFWSSVDDFQSLKNARSYWKGGLFNPMSWVPAL
ncbi:MAG: alpha/beta fold hydrolase, partial [Dehalococcoidia bacterium]